MQEGTRRNMPLLKNMTYLEEIPAFQTMRSFVCGW